MKRIALFAVIVTMCMPCFSQSPAEIWTQQNLCVGHGPGNELSNGSYIMSEVKQIGNGNYRMYYTLESPDSSEIKYAESPDLVNWTVMGRILRGGQNHSDRDFFIGGSSIVNLPNGQTRMYYRCRQDTAGTPKYHVRSAISNDGINFTFEQVVIEIHQYDANSNFLLVGQGTYFIAANGMYVGLFSAQTTTGVGPTDIWMGTSNDGLSWSNFTLMFNDWHDPVVVKKGNTYYMYATYLLTDQGVSTSPDGINWSPIDTVELQNSVGTHLNEQTDGCADIGAVVTYANTIELFSNFGVPSVNLARYTNSFSALGMDEEKNNEISIYPVPVSDNLTLQFEHPASGTICLYDLNGQQVNRAEIHGIAGFTLPVEMLAEGIYFIEFTSENGEPVLRKKLVISR